MRIALLEDNVHEREQFFQALHAGDIHREAECFSSVQELLNAANDFPRFTVAFLDIYLPAENGIDAAKKLKEISPETNIVFLTSSKDYAIEAFNLNALHYIIKPVHENDIREVFERIRSHEDTSPAIELRTKKGTSLIYLKDISYIQSNNHSVIVHRTNGEDLSVSMKFSDIEKKLNEDFIKLQRGYIANADYIEAMQAEMCILKNGESILLSRTARKQIIAQYSEYIFRHLSRRETHSV